jgi:hypothetical protein
MAFFMLHFMEILYAEEGDTARTLLITLTRQKR